MNRILFIFKTEECPALVPERSGSGFPKQPVSGQTFSLKVYLHSLPQEATSLVFWNRERKHERRRLNLTPADAQWF